MALTRDKLFWDAFAQHGERAVKAAELLRALAEDPSDVEEKVKRIAVVEREADNITREVMNALHQTWITPLDRDEIHRLIKSLDDVVDSIDGIAERFRVYGISSPRAESLALASNISLACKAMDEALHLLSSMKNAERIIALTKAVGEEEHRADKTLSQALRKLFAEEKDAVEIIKWRDLYERLERATDRTLDVANIIEAIVLEHA